MNPSLFDFIHKSLHTNSFNELVDCSVYVSPSIRRQIKTILGVDVSKYFISSEILRDIYKTNGRTTEYTKSDRSLTDSDMKHLQQVLEHPDIVNDASYDVESGMGVRICKMVGNAAYWAIMEVMTEHDAPIAMLSNFVFDKDQKETRIVTRELNFYREWVNNINALKQGDTTVQSTLKRFAASADVLRQQREKIQKKNKKK